LMLLSVVILLFIVGVACILMGAFSVNELSAVGIQLSALRAKAGAASHTDLSLSADC